MSGNHSKGRWHRPPPCCSFCGKYQHEVTKLVARASAHICDRCVDLCDEIMQEESESSKDGPREIRSVAAKTLERIDALRNSETWILGLSTGIESIDKMTSGLQPGELVVVSARPAMGKTAFMMNIVEHAVMKEGKTALVFSLEMSAETLTQRILASMTRIDLTKIRKGILEDADWLQLVSAASLLERKPLLIDDAKLLTLDEIRDRTLQVAMEYGPIDLIVVDHLHLIQTSGKQGRHSARTAKISHSLKAIARDFHCPFIVGSQITHTMEKREDKRPVISDLREAKAVVRNADVVLTILRPHVYDSHAERGHAEISLLKHRDGPTGTCALNFIPEFTKFEEGHGTMDP